jgi:predicted nucleic acid-binding protein
MLLVSDANIFIDFAATELTPLLFRLPRRVIVPNVLYHEELATRHAHLLELGLELRSLTGEQVEQASRLVAVHRGPSTNDLFALTLAKDLGCPLATGDRRLREAAAAEAVDLLGTLSLMEMLFDNALVTIQQVEAAYDGMRLAGRRLPWDEVLNQVERLRTGV